MRRIIFILLVLLTSGICLNSTAQNIHIDLSRKTTSKIYIYVEINDTDHNTTEKLKKIINADFQLLDYFQAVSQSKSQFILKCNYSNHNNFNLEYHLFDSKTGKAIFAQRLHGQNNAMPEVVHNMIDKLIEILTGETPIATRNIVFESGVPKQIYISGFDGTNVTKITDFSEPNIFPDWNQESNLIIFNSFYGRYPKLVSYSPKNGKLNVILKYPGLNTTASFNPDGTKIAVTLSKDGNPEIYIINLRNKKVYRLTRNRAVDTSPTWSPDGSKIAFVSDRTGHPQMYIKDAKKPSKAKRITFTGGYNTNPCWSPKGNLIAYNSLINGVFQIYTIDPNSGKSNQITNTGHDCESPSFAADGRHLIFSQKFGNQNYLSIIDIHFKKPHRLNIKGSHPDWE